MLTLLLPRDKIILKKVNEQWHGIYKDGESKFVTGPYGSYLVLWPVKTLASSKERFPPSGTIDYTLKKILDERVGHTKTDNYDIFIRRIENELRTEHC